MMGEREREELEAGAGSGDRLWRWRFYRDLYYNTLILISLYMYSFTFTVTTVSGVREICLASVITLGALGEHVSLPHPHHQNIIRSQKLSGIPIPIQRFPIPIPIHSDSGVRGTLAYMAYGPRAVTEYT